MKTGPSLALFLALGCVLFVASAAHAQITTADLVGTVRDTTGGVVPGATVTLTNDATGASRSAITADGGTYIFTSLLPGRYTIAVEIPGFPKGGTHPASNCRSINAHRSTWTSKSGTSSETVR